MKTLVAFFLILIATPAAAIPLNLPEPAHLVAPACRWTANLEAPFDGSFRVSCRVERADIAVVDRNAGGPVGHPESPGGKIWFTVQSQGKVWQEERWAKGWDVESFVMPDVQGKTRLTFATERELRTYEFVIHQPPLSATPEPITLITMGAGLLAAGWTARRQRVL